MARSQPLTVRIHITGVRETLAAFRRLPKEASAELRERTLALSQALANRIQAEARSEGRQAALLAPTVKANRDRVPSITAGGTKRVGSRRKPAWKLLFGSEFGSDRYGQFKPHLGRGSYWLFRTVEAEETEIGRAWLAVADAIVCSFTRDGV